MFEYLTGKITYLCPQYLVLEVQQVGYRLLVANPYRYQLNQTQTLYVEQIIRDNDQTLYGFYDLQEKELFQQLTSVAGIGPKSALAILADDDHMGLINAIVANDVQFLTHSAIKKIAPQLAQMELTDAGSYVKAGLKLLQ